MMKFLCNKQVNNNGDRHVDNDDKTPGRSEKHCRAQARIPQS